MYSTNEIKIEDLLGKMVVQLSCREFCALTRFAAEGIIPSTPSQPIQAVGIHSLAESLGCSVSCLYAMKSKGILGDAIISHIGKKVVFDVQKARELANTYQKEQRASR